MTMVPIVRDVMHEDKVEILPGVSVSSEWPGPGFREYSEGTSSAEALYSHFRYIFMLLTLKVLIDIACICCYPYKQQHKETDPR
jgi:hypothetical protein